MNHIQENLLKLCQDFIEIAEELYENEEITYEQYVEITKLKLEYIQKNLSPMY